VAGLHLTGHMPGILSFKLDKIFFRNMIKDTYHYQTIAAEQSEWRIAQGSKIAERDIFTSLLEARDPQTGLGMTLEEIISEAGLLIIAGYTSSASAVTSTLFYLLNYPDALAYLQNELLNQFDNVEEIRGGPKLQSCCYLKACIDESMRLSPGVGGLLPREVLPGGITVDGEFFPPGTDIGVARYAIQHEEAYFPDPFAFKPSRWLTPEEYPDGGFNAQKVLLAKAASSPFSSGRSSCVGKTLAYQEMTIIIARMVWLFDMRLDPEGELTTPYKGVYVDKKRYIEFPTFDGFVATHNGPMIQFKLRDGVALPLEGY